MLPTVDLDNQPCLEADKIKNIAIEGNLPFELQPLQLFAPQRLQKQVFGLGGVSAHGASEGAMAWRDGLAQ